MEICFFRVRDNRVVYKNKENSIEREICLRIPFMNKLCVSDKRSSQLVKYNSGNVNRNTVKMAMHVLPHHQSSSMSLMALAVSTVPWISFTLSSELYSSSSENAILLSIVVSNFEVESG